MRSDIITYIDYLGGVYDDYVADTTYGLFETTQLVSDVVTYDGIVYKSIQSSNIGNTPDSSPLFWEVATDGTVWLKFYPDNIEAFKNVRETDQFFKRKKWGKVEISNDPDLYTTTGLDVYKLYNIILETALTLEIKVRYKTLDDLGAISQDIYGYFGVNDCEIDTDRKTIIVSPTIQDKYTSILENWDNKINFSQIVSSTDDVDLNIKPIGTHKKNDWSFIDAPQINIPGSVWGTMGQTLAAFFDGQAPKRTLLAAPPTNPSDYDGFTLADREEILGEDFSSATYETYVSFDTYEKFDDSQATSDVVTFSGETYKSLQAGNLGNQPDISPLWWENISTGGIYPDKGDWELSEFTVFKVGTIGESNGGYKFRFTTKFSRDEIYKLNVFDDAGELIPPTGSGWHQRTKLKVLGQDGLLWTRKPFNGSYFDKWVLQDEEINPNTSGMDSGFTWFKKRTTAITYPSDENSLTVNTTFLTRTLFDYVFQNTHDDFASKNVLSTFLFNDLESELPILASRVGEGINYVTMGQNYLNDMRMLFTRDFIPDLNPSDTSTYPDVTLKKMLGDFNKIFKNTMYWYIDDNNNLRFEHIKFLDLTMESIDLRYESDGTTPLPELDFTESYKYDKSKMFNRIELRQINASGVDFTDNLILFDKIVSNKRNVDIKLEIETEIFSTDLRHVVENASDLENGIVLIAVESIIEPIISNQVDTIAITGTIGSALISAGGISRYFNSFGSLSFAINNFVSDYYSDFLSIGIELTGMSGDKIRFTKNYTFTNATIVDLTGDLAGVVVNTQIYSVISSPSVNVVREKEGIVSGVVESNGYMALSNLLNDFGRYEGVWSVGILNGVEETSFVTTARTKLGKEILVKGIKDSLFYITNLGIGLLNDSTVDFEEENTKLNLAYRYNSTPTTDGFVLMVKLNDGTDETWFDFGNYTT